MSRFWNFIRNESDTESVELRISGTILDDSDAWIYEWFGIPAASPNAFRQELKKYAGKDIVVWIDSYGGDVFAAAGIYNALKEHDGHITVKIDGKAMSAASIIAMAGDEILMSPVGIMMIHNPWTEAEGDARAMRKAAEILDTVKDTIINAYASKTKKSRDEISSMMDEETWMSASIAVENGFADGILYEKEDDSAQSVMNFAYNRLAIQNSVDIAAKKLIEVANKIKDRQKPNAEHKEEDERFMKINNIEELRAAFPDLVKQIENEAREAGIKDERERIKEIEEISNTISDELVFKAKFEEPISAHELAFQALKADAAKGEEYLINRKREIANSGGQDVDAASESTMDDNSKEQAIINNVAAAANRKRGGKING